VIVSNDTPCAGNDPGLEEGEIQGIEEIDVALLVVVHGQVVVGQGRVDLVIGDGGLDLNASTPATCSPIWSRVAAPRLFSDRFAGFMGLVTPSTIL
jgi:hypothetical protein